MTWIISGFTSDVGGEGSDLEGLPKEKSPSLWTRGSIVAVKVRGGPGFDLRNFEAA